MGTSLVTCSCRFRLWCIFEQYDHELRFTRTWIRAEKSNMWFWNWIRAVNGLCDLEYSLNLSYTLVSMRIASQMMCLNTTGYLGLNITGYLGPTSMYLQWDANKIRYTPLIAVKIEHIHREKRNRRKKRVASNTPKNCRKANSWCWCAEGTRRRPIG